MTGIDTTAESRAWAAARNVPDDVPDDVMTEHEFLYGNDPGMRYAQIPHAVYRGVDRSETISGFAAHTEAAIARIAHNSIVALDAREQAMGDLEEALAHLFDDTDPTPQSMRLTAARRAWQSWKATT